MDKNLKVIGSRVYFNESMKDLGAARFVLGGVILFFGLFFIWIELYIVGIPVAVFAILLMEHCSQTIVNNHNMLLIKKTGWIKPFITLKMTSIAGVVSISMETENTKRRSPGRVVRNTSISYKLNFEMPDKKLHINTFTDKTIANTIAKEIAQLIEIDFIKNSEKQTKRENNEDK